MDSDAEDYLPKQRKKIGVLRPVAPKLNDAPEVSAMDRLIEI